MDCDVLVAGGGSAGLAAAIAAARLGARTLLVERHDVLGGMAAVALVHSICGLYRLPHCHSERSEAAGESGGFAESKNPVDLPATSPDVPRDPSTPLRSAQDDRAIFANTGFAAEFAKRLVAAGGACGPERMGRVDVLLQRPFDFATVAGELVRETPGLEVRFGTEIIAADEAVTLRSAGNIESVAARACVDATGDAALAALRGAACEMESAARLQRPAFIFALEGLTADALNDGARLRLAQRIAQAVQAGELPPGALGAHFRASVRAGEAFGTIDLEGGENFDPLDPACLARLHAEGRNVAERLARFLRDEVEGFAVSAVSAWPRQIGVRESRRVVGRYRIEAEDIECGAQFPDTVAHAAWPMELRETARGPRWRFPSGANPCGVPLRALRARDDDALFMAGRCLSCSHEAQAALRVIGTCLATGEAAGLAAALKVSDGECEAAAVNAARRKIAR